MNKFFISLLIVLGLATRFAYWGYPNEVVFDEVHFGSYVSNYFTHLYFFDIHPPLGKLLIAASGYMANFEPGFTFDVIGKKFPDSSYMALRFLPSLAGALLPLIVYLVARQLKLSPIASFAAGIFVVLENGLLMHSRFILLDMFLLSFGFLGFYFYLRHYNGGSRWNLLGMAIFCSFSALVKWIGLSFLGMALIIELIQMVQKKDYAIFSRLTCFIVIPIVIYYAVFMIHFALLTHSGSGDSYMSPAFRKSLVGSDVYASKEIVPLSGWEKFVELNRQMYLSNQSMTSKHPYSSPWYEWPLMIRPISYWAEENDDIYLIGNPVIWWGSSAAIVLLFVLQLIGKTENRISGMIILGGYAFNMLPFIAIHRIMFLYHYFCALVFAILALAYLIDQTKHCKNVFLGIGVLATIAFIYCAPFSYGLDGKDRIQRINKLVPIY